MDFMGLVILLDTLARFSWDRGRPARLNTCGRDARDPRGALSQDELVE